MTRFDIRLRRRQFTQSRIERHKNYQSLLERHYEQSRKKTRGIMVLVVMVILIAAILLAIFNRPTDVEKKAPEDALGMSVVSESSEQNEKTVYRL
jgi:flagellar basal body-associated protein FliL